MLLTGWFVLVFMATSHPIGLYINENIVLTNTVTCTSWYPSWLGRLSYVANTLAADDPETQGASALAAMILTYFPRSNLDSAAKN